MRVAFRVDAGPLIGGGHAMRCLTLADALSARGASAIFVSASMPEALGCRIGNSGHTLLKIPASPELALEGADWHERVLSEDAQIRDSEATARALDGVDWLIIDHYLLDSTWHSVARQFAKKLLVIDDLANRNYDCDLLLDQTFGRSSADYDGLVPPNARILTGSLYALLRPEFARERPVALRRRQQPGPVRRMLVSMGMSDPASVTGAILEQIRAADPDCAVDVVLGAKAASLDVDQEIGAPNPNVTLHVDTREMANLMRDCDLAIGAAGTTSLERCCLGLPSIAVVVAENQRSNAVALAGAGAVAAFGNLEEIPTVLAQLLNDPELLARMSAAAFAIADGRGTERVVGALFEDKARPKDFALRLATMDDAETLWLWRNDPVARSQSRNAKPVTWTDHMKWLSFTLSDPARHLFIAQQGDTPVGMIRFDPAESGTDEVSINIAPEARGFGLGTEILKAGCARIQGRWIVANVRVHNLQSRRLFESCGFRPIQSPDPGHVRYTLPVEGRSGMRRNHA